MFGVRSCANCEILKPFCGPRRSLRWRQGVPVRELADRYNVHRTTVSEHARRHGVAPRQRSLNEHERAQAGSLYGAWLAMCAIGQRFGVSTNAVRTALVSEGVTIRAPGPRPGSATH